MSRWNILGFVIIFLLSFSIVYAESGTDETVLPVLERDAGWVDPPTIWREYRNMLSLTVDGKDEGEGSTVYLPTAATVPFDVTFPESTDITYGIYQGVLNDAVRVFEGSVSDEDGVDSISEEFLIDAEDDFFVYVYRNCDSEVYNCDSFPTAEEIDQWVSSGFDDNEETTEHPPKEWGYIPFSTWFYGDNPKDPPWTHEGGEMTLVINGEDISPGDTIKIVPGMDLEYTATHPGGDQGYSRQFHKGELNNIEQGIMGGSYFNRNEYPLAETITESGVLTTGTHRKNIEEEGSYFWVAYVNHACKMEDDCRKQVEYLDFTSSADMGTWIHSGDDGDSNTTEAPPKKWGYIPFTIDFVTQEEYDNPGPKYSSIAFIPGLQASRLYQKDGNNIEPVWPPGDNDDVARLYMDENGESINDIRVGDIIDRVTTNAILYDRSKLNFIIDSVALHVYDDFMDFLDEFTATSTIAEWQSLPYDWRMSLDDVVTKPVALKNGGTYRMVDRLIEMADESRNGKVTLVGHSNGGLVGKLLIDELEKRNKADIIERFIMIGTPQMGTPKTIASVLHGYDMRKALGIVMQKSSAVTLAQNMPGAYTLMPSEKYFETILDPVIRIEEGKYTQSFFQQYGSEITSWSELDNFLRATDGRTDPEDPNDTNFPVVANEKLLDEAIGIQERLDDWESPEGVEVVSFAGWGVHTPKAIEYYNRNGFICLKFLNCTRFDTNISMTTEGDETVVSPSAVGEIGEKYYLNMGEYQNDDLGSYKHSGMTSFPPLQVALESVLVNKTPQEGEYLPFTKPVEPIEIDRLTVSAHSPVTLVITDRDGNQTGLFQVEGSDLFVIKEDIPGSFYYEIGDGSYISIDPDVVADISVFGFDDGDFDLKIEGINEGVIFNSIVTSSTTVATLTLSEIISESTLSVDHDGDGISDEVFDLMADEEAQSSLSRGGGGGLYLQEDTPEPQVAGVTIDDSEMLRRSVEMLISQSGVLINMYLENREKIDDRMFSTFLDGLVGVMVGYNEFVNEI